MHLGLIGYGNIATGLIALLAESRVTQITVLIRPKSDAPERHVAGGLPVQFVTSPDAFITAQPDVVVECAGHAAVKAHCPPLLHAGHDVIIASVGALADASLLTQVTEAGAQGRAKIILPSGAIGGLDLLRAIATTGEVDVTYRGIKPPEAWLGSPAEAAIDLAALKTETTFFTGSGREAALAYPKNANVVAALALAGADFDRMRVELVADPNAHANHHTYKVVSPHCRYSMAIEATGAAGNARTSVTTVLSILHEVMIYRMK